MFVIQLLDLAVEAHGGLDAWRSIESIALKASLKWGVAAAHYCYDHKNFNGFMVPTRRVVGRSPEGSKPSAPTSVLVQFSDIKFS